MNADIELSYMAAYSKLKALQSLLESDQLDVDELSAKVKEAAGLLKICKEKLFAVNEETRKILDTL
ncbi:MAG: exodeoxyribonuclease VII small subunit [Dysgonamonadaceae bacterium]|jgi:exodeoxyribonuclease VII small subunit|nr:exodeoxyribonuclease VII small subunit [Dysgonamonadaceae bacterium]